MGPKRTRGPQPVNEGEPNNSCTMDVFHWAEGIDLDINAGVPTYGNPGGTGDRTSLITVTTDVALGDGTINNLVDGSFNNDATDALTPVNGQSGKQITFQFPHPEGRHRGEMVSEPKRTAPGSGKGRTTVRLSPI